MIERDERYEHDVLTYNPFEGDFGDGEVTLKDKMIVTKKPHDGCQMCYGPIAKGELSRVRIEVDHGELVTFRWCRLCCDAMAKSWKDSGKAIDKRWDLYRK